MKIQLALDLFELDEAIKAAEELAEFVDVIEIGTPLVIKEGRRAIEAMRRRFPRHEILADYKIMDAGGLEAHIAFDSGASLVTVCGVAHDDTIIKTVEQAKKDGGQVVIDMIAAENLRERILLLDTFGADYMQVHTAFDHREGLSPLSDLQTLKLNAKRTKASVAGGIGLDTIYGIVKEKPDLVVLGSKLFAAKDPRAYIEEIYKAVRA